ncbi:hypothetical protein BBP40_005303 [Aspergillus hancockii]|nr:hypothetical protein BBP40_005303 [Aspergillus hancockii]
MGGFDVYCAICGSTFRSGVSIDSDDETDFTYSGDVLGDNDLEWLNTLCALGLNPTAPGQRKAFLTGQGHYDDANAIYAFPGEDTNMPIDPDREAPYYFYTYSDWIGDQEERPTFPFHKLCYHEILVRCFKNEIINRDVLYALCEELVDDGFSTQALTLDYGDPTPLNEQYWICTRGQELLVTNPVKITQLARYLDELHDIANDEKDTPHTQTVQEGYDIFDTLPCELRHRIFDLLPLPSVLALKAASWSMHTTALPRGNWERRLETDFPWLWEIHNIDPFKSQELEARLSRIVAELEEKSKYGKERVDYILGLANRRRIWNVCESIKSLYHDKLAEREGATGQ